MKVKQDVCLDCIWVHSTPTAFMLLSASKVMVTNLNQKNGIFYSDNVRNRQIQSYIYNPNFSIPILIFDHLFPNHDHGIAVWIVQGKVPPPLHKMFQFFTLLDAFSEFYFQIFPHLWFCNFSARIPFEIGK